MQYWRKEQLVWDEYSSEENPLLFHFLRKRLWEQWNNRENGKCGIGTYS